MSQPQSPSSLDPSALLAREPFLLLGMGPHRRKLLYRRGTLRDACSGELLRSWSICSEQIDPAESWVTLGTPRGPVVIREDESNIRIEEAGRTDILTSGPLRLPRFEGHPHGRILRALHAEVLVNLMPFGPVPNLLVYPRPWYRDSAMMLMVLEHTGNLQLVEEWVGGLHRVFDNNNGECEPDNLGQVLYMVSLFENGTRHPIVPRVLEEARCFERGSGRERHLCGRSDFREHPVYQTKWMKFGLQRLGLDDPYNIPPVQDSYSALVWWAFRDQHVEGPRFDITMGRLYPYLSWAEAHFHRAPPPTDLLGTGPLLTWEAQASQAEYWRMNAIDAQYVRQRVAAPHTWHAAEAFLYLLEQP